MSSENSNFTPKHQRENVPSDATLRKYPEAKKHFKPIEEYFASLPETNSPHHYHVGEKVSFPKSEMSNELVQWNVVHAAKSHYLLECENGRIFDHALCSEEELRKHND